MRVLPRGKAVEVSLTVLMVVVLLLLLAVMLLLLLLLLLLQGAEGAGAPVDDAIVEETQRGRQRLRW